MEAFEAFEALIPLLLILAAAVPKIKKSNWKKKAEELRRAVTAGPLDTAPDMRPMPPIPFVEESVLTPAEPEKKQDAFQPGFVSLPETLSVPEGVDPCHDGLYADEETDAMQQKDAPSGSPLQGNEWVRGVVMGEILSAPKYKAFVRK